MPTGSGVVSWIRYRPSSRWLDGSPVAVAATPSWVVLADWCSSKGVPEVGVMRKPVVASAPWVTFASVIEPSGTKVFVSVHTVPAPETIDTLIGWVSASSWPSQLTALSDQRPASLER